MDKKIISFLQRSFWIIGWAILASTVVIIAIEVYEFFNPLMFGGHKLKSPMGEFDFLSSARLIFSALAQAFFAFLVSAVFDIIYNRAPVGDQRTESYLLLTCIGFVGEGVIGIFGWAKAVYYVLLNSNFTGFIEVSADVAFILGGLTHLFSFIYAATIYILYRHFSKMVTFETEVV